MKTKQLGGDLGDSEMGRGYDDLDIFGLNEFGEPGGMMPIYGALVGAGAGTLGAIAARSFGDAGMASRSELWGFATAVVAGGVMAVFPTTRHAGWIAMAVGAVNNGLRALEGYFSKGTLGMPSIMNYPGTAGLGIIQAQAMNGPGRAPQLMGPGPKISPIANRWGSTMLLPRN